jgi:hypothetical protein
VRERAINVEDGDVGSPVPGRRVHLRSVELREGDLVVHYTFSPGVQRNEVDAKRAHSFIWTCEVTDDVGTKYEDVSGGFSRSGRHESSGERDFRPAPPAHATRLTIIARSRESGIQTGHIAIRLR